MNVFFVLFYQDVQSLPLLKSTHTCEQQIKPNGHLISTVCEENHVFRPFSNEKSGASTSTKQKLTFVRQHEQTSNNRGNFASCLAGIT